MLIRNSLAHLGARVGSIGAGLVNIPLVALTLGPEALGLVGVYAAFQAMLGLFDLGLPTAVNHQLAVLIGRNTPRIAQAILIRTIEVLFWAMAALFLVVGLWAKGPLTDSWFNVQQLPRELVQISLVMIVLATAVRFPVAFYSNVLFGLDRHLFPNAIIAASALLRTLVAFVALTAFGAGLVGFFVIQFVAGVVEVLLLAGAVWHQSGHWSVRPQWNKLRQLSGTAGLLTTISLTAVGLSQIDKIVLSKMLTLSDFGIYSAAYALASGLITLSYPVGNAVFPQLSQILDRNRADTAGRLIRQATELTILLIVPLGAVIAAQAEPALDLLFLFKSPPPQLAAILPLMMLGAVAQGFVTLPHLFQVAATRASVVLWINAAFLLPYSLAVIALAQVWGVWGGALAFAAFNVMRLVAHWAILMMDHRTRSAWNSVAPMVLGVNALALGLAWSAALLPVTGPFRIIWAAAIFAAVTLILAMCLPSSRQRMLSYLTAGNNS